MFSQDSSNVTIANVNDTWEGWEDSAVPPEKVGGYLRDLCKLYEKYEYRSALYGHFGRGCIHCRVNFDLMSEPGIRKWRSLHGRGNGSCHQLWRLNFG